MNEKELREHPKLIFYEELIKIPKQMEKMICRLKVDDGKGTGFFCRIPFRDKSIPVLITNYHIIDEKYFNMQEITLICIITIKNCSKLFGYKGTNKTTYLFS